MNYVLEILFMNPYLIVSMRFSRLESAFLKNQIRIRTS